MTQRKLLKIVKELGYKINTEGLCFGISNMAMQATLAVDLESFNQRIKGILELTDTQIKQLKEKNTQQNITLKSGNKISVLDLMAFFDGVVTYQEPNELKEIIPNINTIQLKRAAESYVSPVAFDDEENRPINLDSFNGVYNQQELTEYLELLKTHLKSKTSLLLTSFNHGINLSYDPTKKEWYLIDANQLPAKRFKAKDEKSLAKQIISAFDAGLHTTGNAIFTTSIFVNNVNNLNSKKELEELKKNSQWQKIHAVTKEKALKKDAWGFNWLLNEIKSENITNINKLLEAGTYLQLTPKNFIHLLIFAAQNGHTEIVKFLVKQQGFDVNATDQKNDPIPLIFAAQNGHTEIVEQLLKVGANANAKTQNGITPLYIAAQNGHTEALEQLLNEGVNIGATAPNGATPLHIGALNGHTEVIEQLLNKGANINAVDLNGATPLHLAALNGHTAVTEHLSNKSANINAVDLNGATPLHLAALNGHTAVIMQLLNKGANINAVDLNGATPLHLAALNGHTAVIMQLLKAGADSSIINLTKKTPLEVLMNNKKWELTEKILTSPDIRINLENDDVNKLTLIAMNNKQWKLAEILLQIPGIDPNFQDELKKDTLAHMALRNNQVKLVETLLNMPGANPNIQNIYDDTLAHLAAFQGNEEAMQLLKTKHADFNQKNNADLSPIELVDYRKDMLLKELEHLAEKELQQPIIEVVHFFKKKQPLSTQTNQNLINDSEKVLREVLQRPCIKNADVFDRIQDKFNRLLNNLKTQIHLTTLTPQHSVSSLKANLQRLRENETEVDIDKTQISQPSPKKP